MPDLDHELGELRERLRESVHPPEVATVIARSAQRTSRRRRQFAAVAAVLAVIAAIPLLRGMIQPVPDEPGTPPPARQPQSGTPQIYGVDFGDELHGFALRGVCQPTGYCATDLLYTEDAQHWYPTRSMPSPDRQGTGRLNWELHALGARRVILEQGQIRWYSEDAGQNWQRVDQGPAGTVPAIPDGAILRPQCEAVNQVCHGFGKMEVVLPDSGRSAVLANPPPLEGLMPGTVPAADGNWWVPGKDPATGRWSVAVSRDAGRTWTVSTLPEITGGPVGGLSVGTTADAVYVTVTGGVEGVKNGLLAIVVSTDAGRTWTTTWEASGEREPRSLAGAVVPFPGGNLVLTTENGVGYDSPDHGRTFEVLRNSVGAGYARWTRVGYLTKFLEDSTVYSRLSPGTWFQTTIG